MTTTTTKKVIEGAEKALYASVGAPVHTAKRYAEFVKDVDVSAKVADFRTRATGELRSRFDSWATEGQELLKGLKDQKVVEDLSERVHLEQIQEQAGKLRTQLEDLVSNWRTNFAPEEVAEKATETVKTVADKAAKTVKKAETAVVEGVKEVSEKLTKDDDLTVINGIGPAFALRLKDANIDTFAKMAKTPAAKLAEAAKVRVELAEGWIAQAKSL